MFDNCLKFFHSFYCCFLLQNALWSLFKMLLLAFLFCYLYSFTKCFLLPNQLHIFAQLDIHYSLPYRLILFLFPLPSFWKLLFTTFFCCFGLWTHFKRLIVVIFNLWEFIKLMIDELLSHQDTSLSFLHIHLILHLD